MKKILILLLSLSLAATTSFAQIRVGLQAGAVYSSIKAKSGSISLTSSKFGPTAGIIVDVPITENLVFQPAINYVQKGSKSSEEDYNSKISVNYIEVPLNILYRTSSEGGFFVGLGPVISPAISGKSTITIMGETETEKIKFGSGEEELKRLEFSGNVLAGYEFSNGLFVSAGYNQGFTNLVNDGDDVTFKNSFFSLKLGFKFGGN